MGAFRYNGNLMRALTRIANMMIVSFFFLVGCLPIVTLLPSCAAAYHTTVKVIRGSGSGVARDFFSCWKANLRQGIPLTLLTLVSGGVLGMCLYFGYQSAATLWGLAYFLIGCMLTLIWICAVLWIPPTLSRFEGNLGTILRLSLYFSMGHPFANLFFLVLLAVVVFLMDFSPLLTLILPVVFFDLIAGSVEKAFNSFQSAHMDVEEPPEDSEEALPQAKELSALELANALENDSQEDSHG